MVYKKFLEKNGKKYGPYLYENKRVGQKIVTSYVGKSESSGKNLRKIGWILFFSLFAILFFLGLYSFFNLQPTGNAVFEVQNISYSDGIVRGIIDINIREGELIPQDAIVTISAENESKKFLLSDLTSAEPIYGEYYSEEKNLVGEGMGYGALGEKVIYPVISFKLAINQLSEGNEEYNEIPSDEEVLPQQLSNETFSESQQDSISEETIGEVADSSPIDSSQESPLELPDFPPMSPSEPGSTSDESSNQDSSSQSVEENLITGEAILGPVEVEGSVSNGKEFTFILEPGQTVSLVPDSVTFNGSKLSDSVVSIREIEGKVIVTSNFSVVEMGFGQNYLGKTAQTISLDLSLSDIQGPREKLFVTLQSQDIVLARAEAYISINNSQSNIAEDVSPNLSLIKDIPLQRLRLGQSTAIYLEEYFSGAQSYQLIANNLSAVFSEGILEISSENGFKGATIAKIVASNSDSSISSNEFNVLVSSGAVNISTEHAPIRLGQEVKWTKNISLEVPENISVEIPAVAENISLSNEANQVSGENVKTSFLTGNVVIDIKLKKESRFMTFIRKIFSSFTGNVVSDLNSSDTSIETQSVELLDNSTQYTLEYTTPAPVSYEENISSGKQVIISAPDNLGYTDVLSYTNIDEIYSVGEEGNLSVYWVENDSYLPFDAYDLNGNGKLDYIEWITPHLSNQTFEINYGIMSGPIDCASLGMLGTGTISDPCQITNWTVLNLTRYNLTASYILMNNLSASDGDYAGIGDSWVPIGNETIGYSFSGNFNGNGKIISDLIIDLPSGVGVGLFGFSEGIISNVGLINIDVICYSSCGGLVGENSGSISNSYTSGRRVLAGNSLDWVGAGGLVGGNHNLITNSYSTCNVSDLGSNSGGLVGYSGGIINSSYSTGYVTSSGSYHGGLVGDGLSGLIINSYYDNQTSGQLDTGKGVGKTTAELKNISTFETWNISLSYTDENNGYPYLGWQRNNSSATWLIASSNPFELTDCGTISSPGTYTLRNNISVSGTCFNITSDNVTLDGNRFSILGDGASFAYGAYASHVVNITLKNISSISNFYANDGSSSGIFFEDVNSSSLEDIEMIGSNNDNGIIFQNCFNNNITNVHLVYNVYSVFLRSSSGNIFTNFTLFDWIDGISFNASSNNLFYNFIAASGEGSYALSNDWSMSTGNKLTYSNNYGEISLSEMSQDISPTFSFNEIYNISNNSVFIDSVTCPALNISANVTLYGIGNRGFARPAILKNGEVCTDCYNFTSLNVDTVVFNVSSWSNYSIGDATLLTQCGTISQPGTYTLRNNISVSGTCFNITSDNVTLDLNGYSIVGNNSQYQVGIFVSSNSTIIKNGFIRNVGANSGGAYAGGVILFSNSNCTVYNLTLLSNYQSLYLASAYLTNVSYLTCFNTSGYCVGVNGPNNTLSNIFSNSNLGIGLNMGSSADFNVISNITLLNNSLYGVYMAFSSVNNNFTNITSRENNVSDLYFFLAGADDNNLFTDYNISTYSLNVASKISLANSLYGRIDFLSGVSGSGSDLMSDVSFSNNSIYVNSSQTGLNKSANVTLLGLPTNFVNPQIMKDGVACTDCYNFTSLNAGAVIFNVSSWSNYSIGEGPNPFALTSCGAISSLGTYTLMNNVSAIGTCFNIASDNVSLDLGGFTITGDNNGPDYGVYVLNKTNISVFNGTIQNFGKQTYSGAAIAFMLTNHSFVSDMVLLNSTYGSTFSGGNNNSVSNLYSRDTIFNGLRLGEYSDRNTLSNISCKNTALGDCIGISSSSYNNFSNLNVSDSNYGVFVVTSSNNTFTNLYSWNNTNQELYSANWATSTNNSLVYQNSYGQIVFDNLRANINDTIRLGAGENLQIVENSVYVNSSISALNRSANVTLYTSDYSGQYPVLLRKLMRGNSECGNSCYNFTSMGDSTVVFNVSDFGNGNVSVGKFVRSRSEIPMTTGWNMISIQTENNETSQDVNVSLSAGWNLIGYSSDLNESTVNIDFVNESGVADSFNNASRNGKVQKNLAYLTGNANAKKYSFVGKTGGDANLSRGKGYWVYANEAGNLTMKGVGGSKKSDSYKLTDLMFRNSSGAELNISDAVNAGWVGEGDVNSAVYYSVMVGDVRYWKNVKDYQLEGFSNCQEMKDFMDDQLIDCDFSTWKGYFVFGKKNNITILRQN